MAKCITNEVLDFTFAFLNVGYTSRLIEEEFEETFLESSILRRAINDGKTKNVPKNLYSYLADEDFGAPVHTIAINCEYKSWNDCEVFDTVACDFIKRSGLCPGDSIIISREKTEKIQDVSEYESMNLGEILECVSKIANLSHCACLGPFPENMKVYEFENIRMVELEFDTESG